MSGRDRLPLRPNIGRHAGLGASRGQVLQMRQAGEKRRLTPTGVMEALHGKELAVDGVVRLIQERAAGRHLGAFEYP